MTINGVDEQVAAKTTLADVLGFIINGSTADDLERIVDMVRQRQGALRALQAAAVSVGDQVRIAGLSPKYLNGLEGVVESISKARGNVRLSETSTDCLRLVGGTRFFIRDDETRYLLRGVPLSCCIAKAMEAL
ncbi:MAG: nitrile hydratase subunit beta [Actinobacteria bacterium]|nr:nitrile hydratase subunit beta [Actinomycetota bacterium]